MIEQSARCLALLILAATATAQELAPFRVLDQEEGAWVDLVTPSVRPLALDPATGNAWAVHAHDSTLVELSATRGILRRIRLPWGPVALATWSEDGQADSILVVCRNSQALVRVASDTGKILSLVPLGSEPADILVHPDTQNAFVSLSGIDSVVEVDVSAATIVGRWTIPSERPTFLALEGSDVLVAPMISGNNSTVDDGGKILAPGKGRVLDLEDPSIALKGLSDHDLFRLLPAGKVQAVARDMGAVLFSVGVHPDTGEIWQLGTEAINKDRSKVGEPAIRGRFIVNQLSRAQLVPGKVVEPTDVRSLDDQDPFTEGIQYDPPRSVGQPYSLAFTPSGTALVTGLLSANVTELDASGATIREWDVGSAPRGVVVEGDGGAAWVLSWGDSMVERYDLQQDPPQLTGSWSLGYDPTPRSRQEGRRLFFDGKRSMFLNSSCASCHVEGDSDLLAWDLSDLPYDDKGPLVTQFMRGIADTLPLHWRGERAELVDFNDAFDGLMGGPPLDTTPGGEFDAFRDYIDSIVQPANPLQHETRQVENRGTLSRADGTEVPANAIQGQNLYFDFEIIPIVGSCNTCHTLPTGTNNDIVFDEPDLDFARRTHFVVASYNGLWRKKQRTLERIQLADGTYETRPTLGVGFAATGLKDDLLEFVEIPLFSATDKQRRNITAFVEQVDSGLAPAVHRSWLLAQPGAFATGKKLRKYLVRQALQRNCDIAIFGEVEVGGIQRELRWAWSRETEMFHAEDSTLAPASLDFFVEQALSGKGRNVVMGLPVGMAERFAIDFDLDGLLNQDELALGTDLENPDSDGDGYPDGHEIANGGDPLDPSKGSSDTTPPSVFNLRVAWVTGAGAKIFFETDELTTSRTNWTSGNQSVDVVEDLPRKVHTVILSGLRKNAKDHAVTLEVTDAGGNTTQVPVGTITTLPVVIVPSVVLRDAEVLEVKDSGGTLHVELSGTVRRKAGGKQSGRALRVNVFVNGQLSQEALQGSTSGNDGVTRLDVIENGLVPGDEVTIVVMTAHGVAQDFGGDWSMPDTDPEDRRWVIEYTGQGL